MSIEKDLAALGFHLPPSNRQLQDNLIIEWPWLEREGRRIGAPSPRAVIAQMMLDWRVAEHYDDEQFKHGALLRRGVRAQMLARGWRDVRESAVYQHLPESLAAWQAECGAARGYQVAMLIAAAARRLGTKARAYLATGGGNGMPFHDCCRRILASFALDEEALVFGAVSPQERHAVYEALADCIIADLTPDFHVV